MSSFPSRLRAAWRRPDRRDPFTWVVALFVVACLAGSNWDIPCTDSWHNDALSPRPCGLFAVVETWRPGHFFRYPPLQMMLLTVASLPFSLAGVLRGASGGADAIARELIEPRYMTGIEVTARLITLLMAVGVLANVRRLFAGSWGPRAGVAAALVTALNPVFVYFAHSGNSDIPCLFWVTLGLVQLDRVMSGEPRERAALLCAMAAALTKDQSAPLFFLAAPWALLVVPALDRGERPLRAVLLRPALWRAVALALAGYLLIAGAITNPVGWVRRIRWITGPANADWVVAGRDLIGVRGLLAEVARSAPLFASRGLALVAIAGLLLVARRRESRPRALLPAVAALSYVVFFVLPSRWTMERHLLPLAILFFAHAGVALSAAWDALAPRLRPVLAAAAAVALAPQVIDVASVDATLAFDSRHAAQRFLAALPPGTTLEIYGGNQYLPNIPRHLRVTRIGPEADAERSPLPGVVEGHASFRDVVARAPDYALVGEDFASYYLPTTDPLCAHNARLNEDPDGRALMLGLTHETLGYAWALRARCSLPYPLHCVRMHRSTGADTWIFRRTAMPDRVAPNPRP